ncbi:MAG: glyoxalase [Actinomycetota bacterium]|nr:MAG: glyoxalase [Actinomycetota bacterium]
MRPENPVFTSSVYYRDPVAALDWLQRVFGFDVTMAIEGPPDAPQMCHYELSCAGRGRVMIGAEWSAPYRSPASVDGTNTQSVHVELSGGLDEHCERARAASAVIVMEPQDQFYGARTYAAVDLEGHRWTFSVQLREVTRAEAAAALGQPIFAPDWR